MLFIGSDVDKRYVIEEVLLGGCLGLLWILGVGRMIWVLGLGRWLEVFFD